MPGLQELQAVGLDSEIVLTWQLEEADPEAAGASEYRFHVRRSEDANGPFRLLKTVEVPRFTDTGLRNRTTYFYSVSVVNASDSSGSHDWESLAFGTLATPHKPSTEGSQQDNQPPPAPEGLRALAGDAQVELEWAAIDYREAVRLVIERAAHANGPFQIVGEEPEHSTRFLDSGLPNGKIAYYRLSAQDDAENRRGTSNLAWATPQAAISKDAMGNPIPADRERPPAPRGLKLSRLDNTGVVSLEWTVPDNAGVDLIRVYRSGGSAHTYTQIQEVAWSDARQTLQALDFAPPGRPYYYVVTAVDSAGNESAYSQEVYLPVSTAIGSRR